MQKEKEKEKEGGGDGREKEEQGGEEKRVRNLVQYRTEWYNSNAFK